MKPVPSKYYQERQRELRRLLEIPNGAARNAALSIEEELEAEFVHAWNLSDDADGVSLEVLRTEGKIQVSAVLSS